MGEQIANMLISLPNGAPSGSREGGDFEREGPQELRYNLAHLSGTAVRDFYERAYQDCRLVYHRLPSPRKMQTLVQAWKQLRKWR
jgi:hypothetical protein